jgi:transposase
VFSERTSAGLDVHARSVVACALDAQSGQLRRQRLTPNVDDLQRWLSGLPAPVAVTYEAGPIGFGLARTLTTAGVRCMAEAPSKLHGRWVASVSLPTRGQTDIRGLVPQDGLFGWSDPRV